MKRYRLFIIIILLWFIVLELIAISGNSQTTPSAFPDTLRILQWNIRMLPKPYPLNGNSARSHLIADVLSESKCDLIVFNEAFPMRQRNILWKSLSNQFPYQSGDAGNVNGRMINSGVWVVSRLPITEISFTEFKDCESWDCKASKGATVMTISSGNNKFQLIATHLQSDYEEPAFHLIRHEQLIQMKQAMDEAAQVHVPQIIAGDFNIDYYSMPEAYQLMIGLLNVEDAVPLCRCYTFSSRNEMVSHQGFSNFHQLLDYVMIRKQSTSATIVSRDVVNFRFKNKKKMDLSDHYAILAKVVWNDGVAFGTKQ